MRLNFNDAALSMPISGGLVLAIVPRRLLFLIDENGSPNLEMRIECSAKGLPHWLGNVFDGETFDAYVTRSEQGATIEAATVRERLSIPLPSFEPFAGSPAWNLDEVVLSAKRLRIQIERDIRCSIDIGLDVPVVWRSVVESHIDLRITATADDVRLELLSSPFRALESTRDPRGALPAFLPLGEGELRFLLPVFRIDWVNRCIIAVGQVSHRNVSIPLAPVRALLERAGMQSLSKQIPDSIALQSVGLTGIAAALTDLMTRSNAITDAARKVLEILLKRLDRLPQRLRDSFLHVDVPKDIAFRVECTFDFDARIHLSTSNDPARAQASPIRLLVPLPGQNGPQIIGLTLYRLAIGEIRAGQLFIVEVDAEIDRFELLSIALSTTLGADGLFPSPDELQSRLSLRDVVSLIVLSG